MWGHTGGARRFTPPTNTCPKWLRACLLKDPSLRGYRKNPSPPPETACCLGARPLVYGASIPLSKDIHNGPKLGRKSLSVCRAGACGFALAGGQLSAGPHPSPSSLRLQLELSSEGRRHFLCPLPLISRHSWQAGRRGSKHREGAGPPPSSAHRTWKWGERRTWSPEKADGVTRALPVCDLPLWCLPGPQQPSQTQQQAPRAAPQAGRGRCPLGLHSRPLRCLDGG